MSTKEASDTTGTRGTYRWEPPYLECGDSSPLFEVALFEVAAKTVIQRGKTASDAQQLVATDH
jgi:hypothetical protein